MTIVDKMRGGKHNNAAEQFGNEQMVLYEPSDYSYISKDGFRIKIVEKKSSPVGGGVASNLVSDSRYVSVGISQEPQFIAESVRSVCIDHSVEERDAPADIDGEVLTDTDLQMLANSDDQSRTRGTAGSSGSTGAQHHSHDDAFEEPLEVAAVPMRSVIIADDLQPR